MPSPEARRDEKETAPPHGHWSIEPWPEPVDGGFLLHDVIPRCAGCLPEHSARVCIVVAAKRGSSIHSVFKKFTKSCFCWSVNPILKRWS